MPVWGAFSTRVSGIHHAILSVFMLRVCLLRRYRPNCGPRYLMKILGIGGIGGDAAAVVLDDGVVTAAVEEESLARAARRTAVFPMASIAACLRFVMPDGGPDRFRWHCITARRGCPDAPHATRLLPAQPLIAWLSIIPRTPLRLSSRHRFARRLYDSRSCGRSPLWRTMARRGPAFDAGI